MKIQRMTVLYFSPTGGTKGIALLAAQEIAQRLKLTPQFLDFTAPENRQRDYLFQADELLLAAVPVYAGRVPNKLLPDLKARLAGSGAPALPICVFGNRSPDEALRELVLLLEQNGFYTVGAAAFASRHAFSSLVGAGRPDAADQAQIRQFARQAADKLAGGAPLPLLDIDRHEIGPYYTPLKADGSPAKFLKAVPLTDPEKCTHCGLCAKLCPMGSIEAETAQTVGICIKCQACVQRCPASAKQFHDTDFLSHVAMLEEHYSRRAENTMFI